LFRNIFPALGQRNAENEPSQPVYYTEVHFQGRTDQ
jgi:hypothetical protein